jgi:glycosyltransferase 2 family protein
MVALISALVSIIPFTPAGLGFVEGFTLTALTQIAVPASTAAAIALLDRVITYLSLIVIGIPLYLWMLRREFRIANEDAD